ncbi:prepilin peptidase [Kangiella sediminilitoris]|uniref:Prepilin leader peptidase/N-methyltransferase n=1 Tax=Kangiella sediminilitoris TaxID=1144748 RepID=A0A1B3BCB1_9GAMM|nr:A24 family peptidase [Kangiella sediminilitoris]AOE50449.1 methyltransferase [Kangiella sediminilitoris]
MIELLSSNLPLLAGFVFVLGLLFGSFYNVVIYRLPTILNREWRGTATEILTEAGCEVNCPDDNTKETFNLVTPRSKCPKCGHKISAFENIPVFSWIFLGGKCRSCKSRISFRYPFVELLTAFTFAVCAWSFGFSWLTVYAILFTSFLIIGSFIDYDHKILPDQLTLPLVWVGLTIYLVIPGELLQSSFAPNLSSAVIGALCGYLVLWSIYWLFKLITGKEGMGHGDFKLLAAIGAFVGVKMLPLVIILSTVTGAVLGILTMIISKKGRDHAIPFGPFLAIAGWITLIWGEPLTQFYLSQLAP